MIRVISSPENLAACRYLNECGGLSSSSGEMPPSRVKQYRAFARHAIACDWM